MAEIAVSVICFSYNHEKYIRKTLDGFLMQKTSFPVEFIIHDDASTDRSADIIREYAEQYPDKIIPIFQTENKYQNGYRGKILEAFIFPKVRGKYVAFCEGDDYWCDDSKLQTQFLAMESHPECAICVHRVQCINEDGTMNQRVIPEESYDITKEIYSSEEFAKLIWLTKGYPFHTSSYFLRKEILSELCTISLPIQDYLNGDQLYMRFGVLCGGIYYIDKAMSCRRLMSIGNWNSRFRQQSSEKRMHFYKQAIEGEQLFNEYSKGKYSDYISISIIAQALNFCLYKPQDAKKIIKGEKRHYKDIKKELTSKQRAKYLLCMYCPSCFLTIIGKIRILGGEKV